MTSLRLRDIALCSLRRRKAKAVLVGLGLITAAATVTSVSATSSAVHREVNRQMDEYGANMVVVPESADLALQYGGVEVANVASSVTELTEEDAAKIRTIKRKENINIVAPKLLGVATVNGQKTMIVGVRFPEELRMRRWWSWHGHEPGVQETLLGSEVARRLGKEVGDAISVDDRAFTVAAVLETTGTQDDTTVYADLGSVQEMLGKPDKLSMIEVSAWCVGCPIETMVLQIGAKLPNARVSAVKQAVASKLITLDTISRFATGLSLILLVVAGLMVAVTTMASVNERAREIGVFRAIGFRKRHVMQVIMTEVMIVALIGGLAGFLCGMMLAVTLGSRLVSFNAPVAWDPLLLVEAMGLSVILGMLGGVYPAWRAAQMDPLAALRAL